MLFSEVYGTYYNTVAKIIEKALCGHLSADGLYSCIMENAFSESVVPITDAIAKEKWQILKFAREKNNYSSILKHNPEMPITNLQRQYLKALLLDKRIQLFDLDFDYFEKQLDDVEPLWRPGDYEVFDKFDDGDDFEDVDYKKYFRMILEAKHEGLALDFTVKNRHGRESNVTGIPKKIEYSEKDDKFRVILSRRTQTINLGRIVALKYAGTSQIQKYTETPKTEIDTIILELTDERNALERVSMHFANLKKKTVKLEDNKYRIELEFSRDDEIEMVIRLLQFGPVIKVLEPDYIVAEILKRINMQLRLMM